VYEALGGKFRNITIITSIKQNGTLARARVKEGSIITHINDRQVLSESD
jgi:S1-C subfamily serine protease